MARQVIFTCESLWDILGEETLRLSLCCLLSRALKTTTEGLERPLQQREHREPAYTCWVTVRTGTPSQVPLLTPQEHAEER